MEGSAPIHVVESPGKALALQHHGWDAVGLGGVQTTLTKKDYKLNESWNVVALFRREVVIVSDAGRAWNADVARAEARLAMALELAGAKVRLAALPPREGGGDQGPDDLLAASGNSELRKVLDAAVAADPVARAKSVSAEQAIPLLGDLPFLWSLKERGVAIQKQVTLMLRKHSIKESDLRSALKEAEEKSRNRRAEADQTQPRSSYAIRERKLCVVTSPDGVMEDCQPLTNFTAQIDRDELLDDGAEKRRRFIISGTLEDGRALPPVRLDPSCYRAAPLMAPCPAWPMAISRLLGSVSFRRWPSWTLPPAPGGAMGILPATVGAARRWPSWAWRDTAREADEPRGPRAAVQPSAEESVSASATRATASRSTSFRFRRADSRIAAEAMRSISRSEPDATSCRAASDSREKSSCSAPAPFSRKATYSAVSSTVAGSIMKR
ncbi:DUF3854 domain-containing protein [Sorangium sp. So ce1153]|uniref:DUF3854 domain-containing protein n=1 Tax=Sorangium sp. So ce1153 TaxID=3133333 RepID=UPI003F5FFC10